MGPLELVPRKLNNLNEWSDRRRHDSSSFFDAMSRIEWRERLVGAWSLIKSNRLWCRCRLSKHRERIVFPK